MKLYSIAVYMLACGLSNSWWNLALAIDNDLLSGGSSLAENESANISQTSSGQGTDTHLADNCQESQSPTVQGVELDINTTVSTNDFDIATSGDVKSFTPRSGFAFSKVVEIDTDSSQTKELYQTSDTNKFVTKVEYNTNKHEVELYMGSETYKLEKVSLQGASGKHEWVSHRLDFTVEEEVKPMEDVGNPIVEKLDVLKREYRKENELEGAEKESERQLDWMNNDLQIKLAGIAKDLHRQIEWAEKLEGEINDMLSKGHKRVELRKLKYDIEKANERLKNMVTEINKLDKRSWNVIKKEMISVRRANETVKEWDRLAGIYNDQLDDMNFKWEEDKLQDFQSEVDGLVKQNVKNVRKEMTEKIQNLRSVESNFENLKSEVLFEMELEELEKLKIPTKKVDAKIENKDKADESIKRMEDLDIDKEEDEVADCSVETKETDVENKEKDESKELTESELKELEQWKRDLQQQLNQIMNKIKEWKDSNGWVDAMKLDFVEFKEFISEFERNLESAMDDTEDENEYENLADNSVVEELEKIVLETKKLDSENKEVEKEMKEVENIVTIKDLAELEDMKTGLEEELKWITDVVGNIIVKASKEDEIVERVKNLQQQKAEELKRSLKEVEIEIEDMKKASKEFEKKEFGNVVKEAIKELEEKLVSVEHRNDLKEKSENNEQVKEIGKKSYNEDEGKGEKNNEQSSVWLS